ncbi:MAG TPA: hypothetical protein VMS31_05035 [Pyrinomonadaceae bacterium]|nr:hypothetical protein [Pyrinomonadaceae bacterium]
MAELFSNFEVNKERRWPIICWLLEGSLVVHLLGVLCVLYIPGVRDAFNIAVLFSDTRFVDKPYVKTEIGDDVQMVELTSNKFRYPDGYFASESQLAALPPPAPMVFTPGAPPVSQATPPPSSLPSPMPTATPLPVTQQSPVAQANASPSPTPGQKTRTPEEAQAELEKTAASNNIELPKEGEINKKALKDFAALANEMKLQGKLDLDKPFEIVVEAELDEHGKLKNARFTKKAGDPNLVELFGEMISALNDSGFLIYLKPLDKDNPGSKVVFTVKQGESEVLASVESEASSDDSARVLTKGFNAALVIGAESRQGKDEEVLLRNTSAEQNGKKIIFNFTMPRQAVVDLIKKQLAS